jgi:hypothetical protein
MLLLLLLPPFASLQEQQQKPVWQTPAAQQVWA